MLDKFIKDIDDLINKSKELLQYYDEEKVTNEIDDLVNGLIDLKTNAFKKFDPVDFRFVKCKKQQDVYGDIVTVYKKKIGSKKYEIFKSKRHNTWVLLIEDKYGSCQEEFKIKNHTAGYYLLQHYGAIK